MKRIEFEDALVVEPAKVSVLDELPVGSVIDYDGTEVPEGYEEVEDDLHYKVGDKFSCSINHGYTCAGVISGSKKSLFFSIHTPKSLKYINSFSVNNLTMSLRYEGSYIGAGTTFDYASDTTNYTVRLYKVNEHTILIMITSVQDFSDINNISLTVDMNSFDIELN